MVGERIRRARQGQQRSLAEVASKAKISVATLSRIENDKQSVALALFLLLARVLKVTSSELLGEDGSEHADGEGQGLARRIATLEGEERARFWRDLVAERRTQRTRARARSARVRSIAAEIEELLAHVEFLREELESVRIRIKRGAGKLGAG